MDSPRTTKTLGRVATAPAPRPTQAQRRARSRTALLESAAHGLSRYGYGNLVLEHVARDAGYTRGALYHQFKDKEQLALAVLGWAHETWHLEVADPATRHPDPVAALLAIARDSAILGRRDIARAMMALKVEFSGQDHPIAHELQQAQARLIKRLVSLINAGRRQGSIPTGPPAQTVALALWGAVEGIVLMLAGHAPLDERMATGAAAGVLGLDATPTTLKLRTPVTQAPRPRPG